MLQVALVLIVVHVTVVHVAMVHVALIVMNLDLGVPLGHVGIVGAVAEAHRERSPIAIAHDAERNGLSHTRLTHHARELLGRFRRSPVQAHDDVSLAEARTVGRTAFHDAVHQHALSVVAHAVPQAVVQRLERHAKPRRVGSVRDLGRRGHQAEREQS